MDMSSYPGLAIGAFPPSSRPYDERKEKATMEHILTGNHSDRTNEFERDMQGYQAIQQFFTGWFRFVATCSLGALRKTIPCSSSLCYVPHKLGLEEGFSMASLRTTHRRF